MARIRTIKPEFWTDEDLAEASECACLLAIGLLNYADDEGYFNANPKLIKAAVFPLREPSVPITVMIRELSNHGYLSMFSAPDGKHFGLIKNFTKHQVVNKGKESKIKELELLPYEYGTDTGQVPVGMDQGMDQGKDKTTLSGEVKILTDGDVLQDPTPPPKPVQPEFIPEVDEPIGKFSMHTAWRPSQDFRRRAGVWNRILDGPDPGYTDAELSRFVTYWQAEGKVFHHVQWEQKFADSVLYERRQALNQKSQGAPNGKPNQATLQHSGESRAMQKFRQATAERHGDDFVQAVAGHGRDLQRPVDIQERGDTYIDLGSDDWSSD
ncbi:primosomal protein [Sodalis ligni]|uniref:DnaT-like ssDNA-binding domain-containing protein n=1 Tax=Sodalis ligni TaxID=2697027 RepID=UPI00193F3142|nr:DnaT-like ssDNA-binding domain-containing protein [Sodalis ligni]QWA09553.1 primosomal protein [Sodalis ligni]